MPPSAAQFSVAVIVQQQRSSQSSCNNNVAVKGVSCSALHGAMEHLQWLIRVICITSCYCFSLHSRHVVIQVTECSWQAALCKCPMTCVCRGRKREENRASLDGILDALNLNGSNPIAVMTQDISRSFLAGSNEKSDRKKFDIYMEATLLAQSQENYQVSTDITVIRSCWMSLIPPYLANQQNT